MDENWSEKGAEAGAYLKGQLTGLMEKYDFITEVRGKGMLLAIQMSEDNAGAVIAETAATGLLLNAVRPNMIRFMPPLTTSEEEIDEAVGILDSALAKVFGA